MFRVLGLPLRVIDWLAVQWLEWRTKRFTREIEPLLMVLRETQRPGDESWTVALKDTWLRGLKNQEYPEDVPHLR